MRKTQHSSSFYRQALGCVLLCFIFMVSGCLWFKRNTTWVTVSWKPGEIRKDAEDISVYIGAEKVYYGYLEPDQSRTKPMEVREPYDIGVCYWLEGDSQRFRSCWSGCPVDPGKQRRVLLEIRPGQESIRTYMPNVTCWIDGVKWIPNPKDWEGTLRP